MEGKRQAWQVRDLLKDRWEEWRDDEGTYSVYLAS